MALGDKTQTGLTKRTEEYLETILNMTVEGQEVVGARLAERLEVSAPTVSSALGRLRRDELIRIDDKRIFLSVTGYAAAVAIVRRHRLVERFLIDYLGIEWADVHEQAGLLEHAISPIVEERLYARLGHPRTCPHGNPIPTGPTIELPDGERLSGLSEGRDVEIVRVTEEVSDDTNMMRFFQDNSLTPGSRFRVSAASSPAQTISLESIETGAAVVLSLEVASTLFVSPAAT